MTTDSAPSAKAPRPPADLLKDLPGNLAGRIGPAHIAIAVFFLLLFYPTIMELMREWSENDNYSHGFLIPVISLYMAWSRRERWAGLRPSSFAPALAALILSILLHIAANIGAELFTMRCSMIFTLAALIWYLGGTRIFIAVFIPLAYLIFMVPIPAIIWNKLAFPLQLFAARTTAGVVQAMGISILREGNILHLAMTSLEVVDACSGLRSLTSLLALGGAFAYLTPIRNISRWLLFFSAVPIAVAVNILRLTATAIMATRIGEEAAQGFLHDMSGMFVFVVAFLLLFMVSGCLGMLEKRLGLAPPASHAAASSSASSSD